MRELPVTTPEPRGGCDVATRPRRREEPREGAPAEHLAELHDLVTRHVRARRAEGARLEQVLAELDGHVEWAERAEGSPDALGLLVALVRTWGLAAYVDEPEVRNVARLY